MTELRAFLASLYDSVSEAEMTALRQGQSRLATLLEEGAVPRDVALPVYHASDVEVTLDVALTAEETDSGRVVSMAKAGPEDASTLRLTLDLFELIDAHDLAELGYDDILEQDDGTGKPDADVPPRARPATAVHGIGPTYAARLREHGVETVGDLVELSPETLAELVSGERIDVSEREVGEWVEAAKGLLAVLPEGERPVELVDGIGPIFGRRLRDHDIVSLSDLVQHDPEELAAAISTEELTVSAQQTAGWLEQARRVLAEGDEPAADHGNSGRTAADASSDDRPETDEENRG